MEILVATAVYTVAFALFAYIATARAHRDGGHLSVRWFAAFGVLGLAVSAIAGARGFSFPVLIASAAVAICAVSDIACGLLYNGVVGPASAAIAILATIGGQTSQMLIGAAIGLTIPLVLHVTTRGRGLGMGDVKLFAIVGLAFGALGSLAIIATAFVSGACYALIMLGLGRARFGASIPFAPFIALGTMGVACTGLGA